MVKDLFVKIKNEVTAPWRKKGEFPQHKKTVIQILQVPLAIFLCY